MKKIIFFFCMSLMVFTAFAGEEFKSYKANQDPFYPDKVEFFSGSIEIKENKLFSLDHSFSFFQIHLSQEKDSVIWYLSSKYFGDSWLFVEKIKFLIDGKIYEILSQNSPKRELSNFSSGDVEENNFFLVSQDFIDSLKNAKSVQVRLNGNHYYQERVLSEKDTRYISWFISQMESDAQAHQSEQKPKEPLTKKSLGVNLSDLNQNLLDYFNNQSSKGIIVVNVVKKSIADFAGIKTGDIIFEFDGKPILAITDLQKAVSDVVPSTKVIVKGIRTSQEITFTAQF